MVIRTSNSDTDDTDGDTALDPCNLWLQGGVFNYLQIASLTEIKLVKT